MKQTKLASQVYVHYNIGAVLEVHCFLELFKNLLFLFLWRNGVGGRCINLNGNARYLPRRQVFFVRMWESINLIHNRTLARIFPRLGKDFCQVQFILVVHFSVISKILEALVFLSHGLCSHPVFNSSFSESLSLKLLEWSVVIFQIVRNHTC